MIIKFEKYIESHIPLKPSDFADIDPMNCVFKKGENETIASNIMKILKRTGDKFRDLSWEEYKKERLKDGNFTNAEKPYFMNVIKWCSYGDNAKRFSPFWDIKPKAEIDADKYNL